MTHDTQQENKQFNKTNVIENYHASRISWPGSASYHRHLNDYFLERLPQDGDWVVLDDMCGTGVFLPTLNARYKVVVGVDLSEKVLPFASAYGDKLAQSDAMRLPFKDHSFDMVAVRGGLHHVPRMDLALGEIVRVLKPGGFCALLEPREDNPLIHFIRRFVYRVVDAFDPEEEHGIKSIELRDLVSEAGLTVTHQEPYGLLGFALFCNPDTIRVTRPFSFLPGAARLAGWLYRFDRWLNRLPLIRAFAFETFLLAQKI